MTKQETLNIFERDNTITPRKLRMIGYIPATIYGKTTTPVSIQVKTHELELALARGIKEFSLDGLGKQYVVQVKQVQKDSARNKLMHVEFFVPSDKQSA